MSRRLLIGPLAAVLLVSGCAGEPAGGGASSSTAGAAGSGASAGADGACALAVSDAWVKAADAGMTAAFAVIANAGADAASVTAASSASAPRVEIHEVASVDGAMVMRPKEGGLVIPAGGSATLAPGGDHLMLMDLPAPIESGDEVSITLSCAAGGTVSFTAVAKPFDGAAEDYVPSASPTTAASGGPSPSASTSAG